MSIEQIPSGTIVYQHGFGFHSSGTVLVPYPEAIL